MKGPFRPIRFGHRSAHFPFVRAVLVHNGRQSIEIDALLDTGAACNLIPLSSATVLLNMSAEEIRKGVELPISGVGGQKLTAYGWQVDLHLRATSRSDELTLWANVWVYVLEGNLPLAQMLIGQSDGFEDKPFVHLNTTSKRYWIIRS